MGFFHSAYAFDWESLCSVAADGVDLEGLLEDPPFEMENVSEKHDIGSSTNVHTEVFTAYEDVAETIPNSVIDPFKTFMSSVCITAPYYDDEEDIEVLYADIDLGFDEESEIFASVMSPETVARLSATAESIDFGALLEALAAQGVSVSMPTNHSEWDRAENSGFGAGLYYLDLWRKVYRQVAESGRGLMHVIS